jgi:hypothetical protein
MGLELFLMLSTNVAKNPPDGGGVVMRVNLGPRCQLAGSAALDSSRSRRRFADGTPTAVDWTEWAGVGGYLLLTFIMVGLKKRCHQSRSTNATCEE